MNSRLLFLVAIFCWCRIVSAQGDLSITCIASVEELVWGKKASVAAMGSGGTAPYNYGFAEYCPSSDPPTHVPLAKPNSPKYTFEGDRTGPHNILCRVVDAVSDTADATETIDVLPPNKIEVQDVPVLPVQNNGSIVAASAVVVFKVKRDTVEVGSCANGFAQEKVWEEGDPEPDETHWIPPSSTQNFNFVPPNINDLKSFATTTTKWNNLAPGADVRNPVFQKVRVRYFNCEGVAMYVTSCIYKVRWVKINQDNVRLLHIKQE